MKRFLLSMILIVAVTAIQAAKPTTSLKVYATKSSTSQASAVLAVMVP